MRKIESLQCTFCARMRQTFYTFSNREHTLASADPCPDRHDTDGFVLASVAFKTIVELIKDDASWIEARKKSKRELEQE